MSACSQEQVASGLGNAAVSAATPPAAAAAPVNLTGALPDFTVLVDRYGPAVVNITVVEKSQPVSNF
ncbi:MAG: hypothetical protein ACJ8MR_18160, partial [Povalibacter sp.]